MKKLTESVEQFSKYLPILSILLFAISYLNLYVYYISFEINISDYLSVTEIILISITNLLKTSILFIIPSLIYALILHCRNPRVLVDTAKRQARNYLIASNLLIVLSLGLSFACLFSAFKESATDVIIIIILEIGLISVVFSLVSYLILKKYYSIFILFINLMKIIFWFIVALFFVISDNVYYTKIGKNQPHMVVLKKDSSQIETGDSVSYVGKTNSHYFFYNQRQAKTIIFPSEDIKEIKITDSIK